MTKKDQGSAIVQGATGKLFSIQSAFACYNTFYSVWLDTEGQLLPILQRVLYIMSIEIELNLPIGPLSVYQCCTLKKWEGLGTTAT